MRLTLPRSLRLQFQLRTLLAVMLLAAAVAAILGDRIRADPRQQLETELLVQWHDGTLVEVLGDIARQTGIEISTDAEALARSGIRTDLPIKCVLERPIKATMLLELLLEPLELQSDIRRGRWAVRSCTLCATQPLAD